MRSSSGSCILARHQRYHGNGRLFTDLSNGLHGLPSDRAMHLNSELSRTANFTSGLAVAHNQAVWGESLSTRELTYPALALHSQRFQELRADLSVMREC